MAQVSSYKNLNKNNQGVIPLVILLILFPVIITGLIAINPQNMEKISQNILSRIGQTPSPNITPDPSSSPSSTDTPVLISITISTLTPSPSAITPKATTPVLQNAPSGTGYSRINIETERGVFSIGLVSVDMTQAKMITDTANENDCGDSCPTSNLADFITRNGGFAGIHGTYFCPATYAECSTKKDSFDFPVYNSRLNKWINGGNLFWNDRSIIYYDGSGMHFLRDAKSFGGGLSAGIVNSPGLLDGGNIIVQDFPLSDKQKAKGAKSGIGLRGTVTYLVSASNVDMYDLAAIFKKLGCSSALNLDGGGSTALWFGGYKAGPGRNIPNAIIFSSK